VCRIRGRISNLLEMLTKRLKVMLINDANNIKAEPVFVDILIYVHSSLCVNSNLVWPVYRHKQFR